MPAGRCAACPCLHDHQQVCPLALCQQLVLAAPQHAQQVEPAPVDGHKHGGLQGGVAQQPAERAGRGGGGEGLGQRPRSAGALPPAAAADPPGSTAGAHLSMPVALAASKKMVALEERLSTSSREQGVGELGAAASGLGDGGACSAAGASDTGCAAAGCAAAWGSAAGTTGAATTGSLPGSAACAGTGCGSVGHGCAGRATFGGSSWAALRRHAGASRWATATCTNRRHNSSCSLHICRRMQQLRGGGGGGMGCRRRWLDERNALFSLVLPSAR